MTEIWCVQIVATHGCIVYLYYSIACVRASGHSLASCTSALLKMGYCGLTCHPGKIFRYTHRGIDLYLQKQIHMHMSIGGTYLIDLVMRFQLLNLFRLRFAFQLLLLVVSIYATSSV